MESVHVCDVGLLTAADRRILEYAAASALVIVSADSDFGELMAASRGSTRPSVVLSGPRTGLSQTSGQLCWRRTCRRWQRTWKRVRS
ncbi:DUF5615 family PIN-like protein [Trebonia kvetii]|uniref:DUF5615 family PIN-like protein n=1 Tax=Trebonia kvetii TaxID=2480626 RepID=UPI001651DC2F